MAGKTLREARERRSKMAIKREIGRPTKLNDDLMDKAKQIVPNMMGQGASLQEVAVELGVLMETLHIWEQKNPEFSDIMMKGRLAHDAWWIRQGRLNQENQAFKADLYKWNTQNRIGWSSAQRLEANISTADVIREEAKKRVQKAEKDADD